MAQIPVELTLSTIAGGALADQVATEIRKICANIQDLNCAAETKRKLQINLVFAPNDKRNLVNISYEVKPTLVGPDAGSSAAYLAIDPKSKEASLFEVETHPPLFPQTAGVQTTIPGVLNDHLGENAGIPN